MSNEKDIAEKSFMNCDDVAADAVNVAFFDGKSIVNQSELTDCVPTSQFIANGKLSGQERDVVKYWSKGGAIIAVLGVENQTKVDSDMPLRVISYDGASYKSQVLQHAAASRDKAIAYIPPYPVFTLVVNFGNKPWDKPKSLLECIGEHNIPKEMRKYFNDYRIFVLDLPAMSKEDISKFKSDMRAVAQVIHANNRKEPYEFDDKELVHPEETLRVISALTKDDEFMEAYEKIIESGYEGGISMCRVTTEIKQKGKQEGMMEMAAIIRAYRDSNSIEETAKTNNTSVEHVRSVLQMAGYLPA